LQKLILLILNAVTTNEFLSDKVYSTLKVRMM